MTANPAKLAPNAEHTWMLLPHSECVYWKVVLIWSTIMWCKRVYCNLVWLWCSVIRWTVIWCNVIWSTVIQCSVIWCAATRSTVIWCSVIWIRGVGLCWRCLSLECRTRWRNEIMGDYVVCDVTIISHTGRWWCSVWCHVYSHTGKRWAVCQSQKGSLQGADWGKIMPFTVGGGKASHQTGRERCLSQSELSDWRRDV